MRDMGIRLRLGESVATIELVADGSSSKRRWQSNKTLCARDAALHHRPAGRDRASEPAAAGLDADERGRLKVNEYYQTECRTSTPPATSSASPRWPRRAWSRAAWRRATCSGRSPKPPTTLFPYGIYTIPEISMVGQTEQALTQQGVPYEVGIARYREIARGQLIADPHGLLKLLFHQDSRRLLGVHAIGTGATELIHIGQAVMAAGMPIDYFVESVFNYPTLAECYKVAALDGINRVRPMGVVPVSEQQQPPLSAAA